ncbi:MAG: Hsp70 family protein [Myxococcota bacterium]
MGDVVLGIDLGTTNSVVAVADASQAKVLSDHTGARLIPSVVSFHPNKNVLVGDVARERRLLDARNTVYATKRLIGRPYDSPEVRQAQERFAFQLVEGANDGVAVQVRNDTWSLPEISAYVLRECRARAEAALGQTCDKAVITVPANFNELQRSATKAAGTIAGLEVLRIINEPTAAALAYGYTEEDIRKVAVYDLGGGTFDITILEMDEDVFEVVATAGDTFLGGDDIDLLLAENMADAFLRENRWDPRQDRQAFERLRAASEWAKCMLSTQSSVRVKIPELAYGPGGMPIDFVAELSRTDFEEQIRPLVEKSMKTCEIAMRIAGLEVQEIDRVVLVGGSTRIPMIQERVRHFFEQDPRMDFDPDLVVALGAAIQAYHLAEDAAEASISNLTEPTVEEREAAFRERAEARAERPDQPAFAPVLGSVNLEQVRRPTRRFGAVEEIVDVPAPVQTSDWRNADPPTPEHSHVDPQVARDREVAGKDTWSDMRGTDALTEPVPDFDGLPAPALDGLDEPLLGMDEPLAGPSNPRPLPPAIPREDPPAGRPPPVPTAKAPPAPPPPPAPPLRSQVKMADRKPLLLMDVTPHSLGIETVGGYCERVIRRNAPVPVEQTRIFTTARDGQETVRVTVCQGESRTFPSNQALGVIELHGLRKARRGEVKIVVAFMLDADGTLDVRATDADTGTAQRIRVNLVGGFSPADLDRLRGRQEATL